ncbi:MAG: squalene synthase HpnC [Magnetococcales bacterium]|nr:squalene synthase HpnC [Magnetococcales bacterium]MBF0157505.1 squalene synthase HpnC [Magnetococcales bacterium]
MITFQTIPTRLAGDFRYCREVVGMHSENFPVGSLFAPRRIRPLLHAIYAFARTADDFADLPGRGGEARLLLLDDWSRRLEQAEAGRPDHPIFRALAYVFEVTDLPSDPLHELLIAFRMDVTNKRYDTMAELEQYCRYSANPIGRIVLHLAGQANLSPGQRSHPEIFAYSDAICTALQLTNHWQDLGEDPYSGRPLYLPRELMDRFGVTEEMILARRFSPAIGSLMLHLVSRTRSLFLAGEPLIRAVDWPLKLELAAIREGGMTILDHIEAAGGNTMRVRPHLSSWERANCFWRALAGASL